ncbi:MAG: tripartite tricarboxylate transporter permease [Treponema sp.]|nr:tripartite tricarboxylate transporter permease [Treponema sp.]
MAEILQNLSYGATVMFSFTPILMIFLGTLVGIIMGVIPGISTSMAIALLLPFTFVMNPVNAVALLIGCYAGGNYGGCVPAVTIGTPGSPSAVPTLLDGYPMAKQGRGGEALGILVFGSVFGGILGTLFLILFAGPMANVALRFWPSEYFALCVLGLATVATLGGKAWPKALIAVLFGLMLNTIGLDPILGTPRFTFGVTRLFDGFGLMPVMIGLFALGELFHNIENYKTTEQTHEKFKYIFPKIAYYWKLKWAFLRSSFVGVFIGILPGAGSAIASFLAYDVEKRVSKTPENFGKGEPKGIAASAASDSANTGGSIVPMLALGIPGAPAVAVLMGALMIHSIRPGPELFTRNPEIVASIYWAMILSNLFILVLGILGTKALFVRVTNVKKPILYTFIFLFTIIGSYSIQSSIFDVGVCIAFGIIGWLFKRYGIPVAPVVLGLVLGRIMEMNFRQALMVGGAASFLRPFTLIFLLLAAASIVVPIVQGRVKEKKMKQSNESVSKLG